MSHRLILIIPSLLALVSCQRDTRLVKKQLFESGNKHFQQGQYQEAERDFEKAVALDPRFGLAHFQLGQTLLKLKPAQVSKAIGNYRRAVELLQDDSEHQEEYRQSMVSLSEIFLLYAGNDEGGLLQEVQDYIDRLLRQDPNSFDAFRLRGDLSYVRSNREADRSPQEGSLKLAEALADYRRAEAIRPENLAVVRQIAACLKKHEKREHAVQ